MPKLAPEHLLLLLPRRTAVTLTPRTPLTRPKRAKHAQTRRLHTQPQPTGQPQPQPRRITYHIATSYTDKTNPYFNPSRNSSVFDPTKHHTLGASYPAERNPVVRRRKRPESGEDAFFVSRVGSLAKPGSGSGSVSESTSASESGSVSKSGSGLRSKSESKPGSQSESAGLEEGIAFGIADGVGGWAQSRIDAGDFSHGLCGYMAQTAGTWAQKPSLLRPRELMQTGYERVVQDNTILAGGSTATVAVGLGDGRVEIANLGDSTTTHLKTGTIAHKNIPQTHAFNTPYQLSLIPPRMALQASIFGGLPFQDLPRDDADVMSLRMQHGDVLVLATDGVADNLDDWEVLELVTRRMVREGAWVYESESGNEIAVSDNLPNLTTIPTATDNNNNNNNNNNPFQLQHQKQPLQSLLASTIVNAAKVAGYNRRRDGPFAREARAAERALGCVLPFDWTHGGKVDDTCVLVVVAVEEGT